MKSETVEVLKMPFPVNTPRQMPCPHWNHFPIQPTMQAIASISSCSKSTDARIYCKICKAAQEHKPCK